LRESRGSTLNCYDGVVRRRACAGLALTLRWACGHPDFAGRAGIRLTAWALPELRISQLQSCAAAVRGRQWLVFPAHG